MNVRISKLAGPAAALVALGLVGATALASHSIPYLPASGPSPLRFEVAMARTFRFPAPKPVVTKTNAPAAPVETSTEVPSPVAPVEPVPAQVETAEVQPLPIGDPVEPLNQRASAPASDMLMVTPQMLVEYLKPTPGVTNSNVSVLVPFTFKPPLEKTPTPSSRATYKTE